MPNLYMLIGLPGSGKSTFLSPLANYGYNPCIASTDFFIELAAKIQRKSYNDVFEETIKDAEKAMYEMVMIAVKEGRDIIWDQTNLNRKTRAKKLIMIPDNYRKVAIFFKTPEDLQDRLDRRAIREHKSIPDKILLSMAAALQYPEMDEGFDRIITPEEFINEELRHLQDA